MDEFAVRGLKTSAREQSGDAHGETTAQVVQCIGLNGRAVGQQASDKFDHRKAHAEERTPDPCAEKCCRRSGDDCHRASENSHYQLP